MKSHITYSTLIVGIFGVLSFGNLSFASHGGMPGYQSVTEYQSFPSHRSMPEYQSTNPERSHILPLHLQTIAKTAEHLMSGQITKERFEKELPADMREHILLYMSENFPAYMAKNFPSYTSMPNYMSMPKHNHDEKGEGEGSSGQSNMREID